MRRRCAGAAAAVAALVTVLPPAVHAAPAVSPLLDSSFGTNGVFTMETTPDDVSTANAAVRQADGKLLVAGTRNEANTGLQDVVVARFLANGQLDAAFGTNGLFTLADPAVSRWANGVVIQPSGKIVVSDGLVEQAVESHIELFRLDQNGSLDTTFGQNGFAQTPPGLNGDEDRAGLAVQPDGSLVVGDDYRALRPVGRHDAALMAARFSPDGVPDATFGLGGVATTYVSSPKLTDDLGHTVAVLPDGRVVVGGDSTDYGPPDQTVWSSLAVFTPGGVPDSAFGTAGTLVIPYPAGVKLNTAVKAVAAQPDGKLVVVTKATDGFDVRNTPGQLVVARLTATGALDPTFGTGGVTVVDNADGDAVSVDGQGRIVVSGRKFVGTPITASFLSVRLMSDGSLDASFGGGFVVGTDTDEAAFLTTVVAQPDGRVVAAGRIHNRFTVVRYLAGSGASAFGWNPVGELGTGTTTDAYSPVTAPGLVGAVSVAAGGYHGLAVKGDGSLWSFGWNALGQLGDGTTTDHHSPIPVAMPTGAVSAAAGVYHSLALGVDGHIYSFGWSGVGQLGDGTTTDRHSPVAVGGLSNVVGVAAGAYHSLAVKSDGTLWAWGWNILGQLGDGTTTDRHAPVQVSGLSNVVAVAAGAYSSLALKSDGTVWFWGWNGASQAGDGTTTNHLTPVQVPGLTGVTAIASGYYHSLALKSDGTVRAWGWNATGELGDGTTALRLSPVTVSGLTGVTSIAGGAFHSLAALSNGTVVAWGWNGVGQLGTGNTADSPLPVTIPGLNAVTSVSAGLAQSLVVGGT